MTNPPGVAEELKAIYVRIRRSADPSQLPLRVRTIIAEEDRISEILVGVVQLALGLLLAALYLVSPSPTDTAQSQFMPVPLALTAFLGFGVLRLWLVLKRKLPDSFVALSIAFDIGLFLCLIWSFHIQYGAPPGFALKAPTFVYLFVLVAVRALRFDARYVLAAGITAAAGWAILTVLAIVLGPPHSITRSFTEYITSTQILIGAELDKIIALLAATLLLALNARVSQHTLVTAVREQTAVREIQRFLSRGVAQQITSAEAIVTAGQAIERRAAVIMIDVRGFTALAMRRPPQEVVRILTSLHAEIIPIVRAHRGVVDKFLGDGIMVTFGAVTPSSSAAADAARALEAILFACENWERTLPDQGIHEPLRVNAAMSEGPVVFTILGDGDRLEYTVIGDAVNLAAKLEKHNKTEGSRAVSTAAVVSEAERQGCVLTRVHEYRLNRNVAGIAHTLDLCIWG